jgi:ABC-type Zn uptake system ZnuABC Zn-binding protein ZnuA
MKRRTTWGAVVGLAVLAAGLAGCGSAGDPWAGETATPRVVVTIAPLASFVQGVLGKHGAVRCLCTETGPHHYETDTRDARLFQKADAVFAVGLQLDDKFADALLLQARRKDLECVKLGKAIPAKLVYEMKPDDDEKEKDGHKHDHDHGSLDPHLWLGVPQAVAMVEVIRDKLKAIDEAHADDYQKNAADYIASLKKLQSYGEKELAGAKTRRVISFHDSLGYFAKAFNLDIVDVIEQAPGDEATAPHLRKLTALCKKGGVGAITIEPQYPKRAAEIVTEGLAREKLSVPLVTVDTMETANADELRKEGAQWYEARMRKNINALAGALK